MNPVSSRYQRLSLFCSIGVFVIQNIFAQTTTNIVLAWNPSPASGVMGYNVYSGVASQAYTNMVSLGNVTNAAVGDLNLGTTYFFSVTAVDSAGLESQFSNEISYSVPTNIVSGVSNTPPPPVISNTPPSISSIANQTVNVNTSTGPIAFMIADAQTPATNLTVSASSSNPALVPTANIALSGNGSVWTISITPAAGQSGSANIAVTVCDPSLCTTTNFLVDVIPLPTVALSSPTNGAIYTSPATVNLAANVVANSHTITAVQFYNGTSLLGQVSASPYIFTWTNVATGTYTLTAQVIYDTGSAVSSVAGTTISVSPAATLPPPWQTRDLGNTAIAGSVVSSNGAFNVHGSGNISGSADNFRFLYQNLSGNGEIRARIYSAQNTGSGDLTGAMIRESLTSSSRYVLMGFSPGSGMRWLRRSNTGNGTSSSKAGSGTPPNVWVRVVRSGNTFTGYKSVDGANWTLVNSANITMAPNIYVGLAVASGSTNASAVAVFNNVTVVP